MTPSHIDDFFYTTSAVLCRLYAAFPIRSLLLVEDISGPIKWDMTGLADRKSQATFEAFVWLAEQDLLTYRTVEPRDLGLEGAVLTQKGFVLLMGEMRWSRGEVTTRVDALKASRRSRAYGDIGTVVNDLLRANCQWSIPITAPVLPQSAGIDVAQEESSEQG